MVGASDLCSPGAVSMRRALVHFVFRCLRTAGVPALRCAALGFSWP